MGWGSSSNGNSNSPNAGGGRTGDAEARSGKDDSPAGGGVSSSRGGGGSTQGNSNSPNAGGGKTGGGGSTQGNANSPNAGGGISGAERGGGYDAGARSGKDDSPAGGGESARGNSGGSAGFDAGRFGGSFSGIDVAGAMDRVRGGYGAGAAPAPNSWNGGSPGYGGTPNAGGGRTSRASTPNFNTGLDRFAQNPNDPARSYGLMTGPTPSYSSPMATDAKQPTNFASVAPRSVSPTGVRASGMTAVNGVPNIEWTNTSTDIAAGIVSAANELGIDPVDLATVISYETAGTFNPTKKGPTTQWGQHKGLIQFGQPQAIQHGVDWSNPIASQLGPKGAVVDYMKSAGVTPGMGLMDVYSAVNAGAPGRYNATDAKNGGAPGTVADKVNNQMAGHRAKAESLLADYQATPNASGFAPGRTGLATDAPATELAAAGTTPTPQSSGRPDPAAGAGPTAPAKGDVAIDDSGKAVPKERTIGQAIAAGVIDAAVTGVGGLPGAVAQIAAKGILGKTVGEIVVDQMGNAYTLNGDGSLTPVDDAGRLGGDSTSRIIERRLFEEEQARLKAEEDAKAQAEKADSGGRTDPVVRIGTVYLGHPLDRYLGPSGGLFQRGILKPQVA